MEEFEDHEETPESPNDLTEFVHLQKEIKRLNQDNQHLLNENKDLISKLKGLESKQGGESNTLDMASSQQSQQIIDELNREIFVIIFNDVYYN